MTPPGETRDDSGFTLIEILVATFIMAVLSAMGVAMMTNMLRAREQLEGVVDQVQRLELARAVMKEDFSQIENRRVRDAYGDPQRFVFKGGAYGFEPEVLMAFVRNGHVAPGVDDEGPSLQYVEYLYRNDALIRRTRYRLDPTPQTPERERVLLSGVEDLHVRFFNGVDWSDQWSGIGGDSGGVLRPFAISIEFKSDRYGLLRMLFLTPEGY